MSDVPERKYIEHTFYKGDAFMDFRYMCIDLKSFYASVECVERGLDPLGTNLLVADESRSDSTICLAVSPSLKALGVPSRPRLFEARQAVKAAEIKLGRKIEYIIAKPRMSLYIDYSARVYSVYLKYFAPEDIHVYSVDEVFIDLGPYRDIYKQSVRETASMVVGDVLRETGITATAGAGTNLYLAKIAMDIVAKHSRPDNYGIRFAGLDEMSYRKKLWDHTPLTDFWQIAHGVSGRLARYGLRTMGDIADVSLHNEEFFYRLFGKNAELLIDHAWGIEPCTMKNIKEYRPAARSVSNGQVLPRAYTFGEALTAAEEQAELLAFRLVEERLVANSVTLVVGYDHTSDVSGARGVMMHFDMYGRVVPVHSTGTFNFGRFTNYTDMIVDACVKLFRETADKRLLIRRIFLTANNVRPEKDTPFQLDMFHDVVKLESERRLERAVILIRSRYGSNSLLKGINYLECSRTRERNTQIGGHKA